MLLLQVYTFVVSISSNINLSNKAGIGSHALGGLNDFCHIKYFIHDKKNP